MAPLKSGDSQKTISKNIQELHKANESKSKDDKRPDKQIVAIALENARRTSENKKK